MLSATEFHQEKNSSMEFSEAPSLSSTINNVSNESQDNLNGEVFTFTETLLSSQEQVSFATDKQEARSVCDKISRLLQDKQSGTRGSYMFRKRRKRSEKFAIVGYGTQPADQESDCEGIEEDLDSVLLTSSDDEIDVYDHPGPNNFLKQDSILTTSSKIIRNQYQTLANDAKQMQGRGAKMFAKRQERMEKFIVEGNSSSATTQENQSFSVNSESATSQELTWKENRSQSQFRNTTTFHEGHAAFDPFLKTAVDSNDDKSNSIHTGQDVDDAVHVNLQCHEEKARPKDRLPWSPSASSTYISTNKETTSNVESSDVTQVLEESHQFQKIGFRRVKPPYPSNLHVTSPASNLQDSTQTSKQNKSSNFTISLRKPAKTWSPVKFEPKQWNDHTTQDEKAHVTYPLATSSNSEDHSYLSSIENIQTIPFKSICTLPMVSNATKVTEENTSKTFPCSAKLLQEPKTKATAETPTSSVIEYPGHNLTHTNVPENEEGSTKKESPNFSEPERIKNDSNSCLSKSQRTYATCVTPKHFNRSSNNFSSIPKDANVASEDDLHKPKVAACMKLLDPTKGKYEPKMSIVYQQTPSFSAKLHPDEKISSIQSTPIQFNKSNAMAQDIPHMSYLDKVPKASSQSNKQHQPLGSLAGELKGKGARMFEKQQKRMDHFTRECNGAVLHGSVQPHLNAQNKGPETKTKEKMSKVVGEFKKVSADGDSSKRPSATRTTKSKDPYHYHNYYVAGGPPSVEDFVCTDDYNDAASDSNLSTTSSMTSFDRYSRTSSNVISVNETDERDMMRGNCESKFVRSLPGVAPKPKLSLSVDLNSPSGCSNGEPVFSYLPSPPSYANSTLPSFSKAPESQPSLKFEALESYFIPGESSFDKDEMSSHLPTQSRKFNACPKPNFIAKAPVAKWQPN